MSAEFITIDQYKAENGNLNNERNKKKKEIHIDITNMYINNSCYYIVRYL